MIRLNSRLNLRLRKDLPIGNNNTLLAGVIRHGSSNLRAVHSFHGDIVRVGDLGEAGAVAACVGGAGPRAVLAAAAVFTDEAGKKARGDGFKGGDGGGEDADIGFDDGPVHCAADGVGVVG